MQIFTRIRDHFEFSGLTRSETDPKKCLNWRNMIIIYILFEYVVLANTFLCTEAEGLIVYADSFQVSATSVDNFLIYVFMVMKIPEMYDLMDNFQLIIENRIENPALKKIYEKVNEKVESRTKWMYLAIVQASIPGLLLTNMVVSFKVYFTTDLGNDSFKLPFPLWMPFDWHNPGGYLIAFSIQCVSHYFLLQAVIVNLCFLMGVCEFFIAFTRDMEVELNAINECNKERNNGEEIKKRLCTFIELHGNIKEFVGNFSDIFAFVITASILWGLFTTCSTLLIIQMQLSQGSEGYGALLRPATLVFWSFAAMFLLCEYGQMVTSRFEKIDELVYQMDWHLFPANVQRMLPIIINNTQQPVIISGFANVEYTRETFDSIVNGGFAYYMTFRQFIE